MDTGFKIWVCCYHMRVSLFPVKVKMSSQLTYRTNSRHDTLDLKQSEEAKCFICQRFYLRKSEVFWKINTHSLFGHFMVSF